MVKKNNNTKPDKSILLTYPTNSKEIKWFNKQTHSNKEAVAYLIKLAINNFGYKDIINEAVNHQAKRMKINIEDGSVYDESEKRPYQGENQSSSASQKNIEKVLDESESTTSTIENDNSPLRSSKIVNDAKVISTTEDGAKDTSEAINSSNQENISTSKKKSLLDDPALS
ncbi:hypothetical protein [uncultured Lactobacillus sp.]|uniref:hypothetical protein n=1 Tax=uncultured Lactobacillus sp. TaxID=153152 RepID=UPI002620CAAD|nr:hypothetical protein [uncultured Lactobacillus sp.]